MTDETTRIPVPTNGHARLPGGLGSPAVPAPGPAAGPSAGPAVPRNPRSVPPGVAAGTDLRIAVSPAQLATGFAVLAGLIGIILGARRRRRR